MYLLRRIAAEIGRNIPKDFVLGVKLNSADFVDRNTVSSSDEKVLQQVKDIVGWESLDFLEISGGDYESRSVDYFPRAWPWGVELIFPYFVQNS